MVQNSASEIKYVIYDNNIINDNAELDNSSADEDMLLDKIFKKSNDETFDVDDIMLRAVHAGRYQGVKSKDLAKLCT